MSSEERTATSVDKKLGARVRERRHEIGMSQEELADVLGITFQQVQKYERGVNRIAASRLLDISNALEMSVGKLLEGLGKGARRTSDDLADALATPGAAELLRAYASIRNPRLRRRIMDLVREMNPDEG